MLTDNEKEIATKKLFNKIFGELTESLISELHVNCANVSNGCKLVAYIPFLQKKIITPKIINLIAKHELNCIIEDFPDDKSKKAGWKGVYIFKYEAIKSIIKEINSLDHSSNLYHFANGKIFGYSDYEVINFISK